MITDNISRPAGGGPRIPAARLYDYEANGYSKYYT
jgi:hypothetical protein